MITITNLVVLSVKVFEMLDSPGIEDISIFSFFFLADPRDVCYLSIPGWAPSLSCILSTLSCSILSFSSFASSLFQAASCAYLQSLTIRTSLISLTSLTILVTRAALEVLPTEAASVLPPKIDENSSVIHPMSKIIETVENTSSQKKKNGMYPALQ